MPEAIIIRKYGGPEVLRLEKVDVLRPGPGELRIMQTAVGINFHDIYVRSGLYKSLSLPGIPGIEGVGEILETGEGVEGFSIGETVGYITSAYGGYASERVVPASIAVKIPENIDSEVAASVLLKGLTVQMLTNQVVSIRPGNRILVHAAAGGVGRLLVQVARMKGADVIGTVGSKEKAEIALKAGCNHIIFYKNENVFEKVMGITKGEGLNIVYDSVGKNTFHDSLASLAFEGHLVNFGQSSGAITGFEIPMLAKKSSTLSRPMIFHYIRERHKLLEMSRDLFQLLAEGKLFTKTPITLPLKNASKAHELLESRKLTQPVILIPEN